jgi:hypothetical protein
MQDVVRVPVQGTLAIFGRIFVAYYQGVGSACSCSDVFVLEAGPCRSLGLLLDCFPSGI